MLVRGFSLTLLALLLTFVCVNGAAVDDYDQFSRITADLTQLALPPEGQHLYSSPLNFWLGGALRPLLGVEASFLCIGLAELALFLLVARDYLAQFTEHRRAAVVAFFCFPLLFILTHYIGKSDAVLAASALLLARSSRPYATMLVAALAVAAHRELGTVLLLLHIVLRRKGGWLFAVAGATLGNGLVAAYHHLVLVSPPESRAQYMLRNVDEVAAAVLGAPTLHLFATFGLFWICVAMLPYLRAEEVAAAAACFGLACVTYDFTRVFTLTSTPLFLLLLERLCAQSPSAPTQWTNLHGRALSGVLGLALVVQFQVHLGGKLSGSNVGGQLLKRIRSESHAARQHPELRQSGADANGRPHRRFRMSEERAVRDEKTSPTWN